MPSDTISEALYRRLYVATTSMSPPIHPEISFPTEFWREHISGRPRRSDGATEYFPASSHPFGISTPHLSLAGRRRKS